MSATRDDDGAAAWDEPWQPPRSEFAVHMPPAGEPRRLGRAIYGAGWHPIAEHGIRWDARVLDCYALHLVPRGSGWIEGGDRPRTRLPAHTHTHPPGTIKRDGEKDPEPAEQQQTHHKACDDHAAHRRSLSPRS